MINIYDTVISVSVSAYFNIGIGSIGKIWYRWNTSIHVYLLSYLLPLRGFNHMKFLTVIKFNGCGFAVTRMLVWPPSRTVSGTINIMWYIFTISLVTHM